MTISLFSAFNNKTLRDVADDYGRVTSHSNCGCVLLRRAAFSHAGCCALFAAAVIACVLQSISTVFLLVFAATNLDLSLGPLSNAVPQQCGVISGIAGLVSSFGAVGIIIANLQDVETALWALALALGADATAIVHKLNAICVLSYVWIALTSHGAFSTTMGFVAAIYGSTRQVEHETGPELEPEPEPVVSRSASPCLGNDLDLHVSATRPASPERGGAE